MNKVLIITLASIIFAGNISAQSGSDKAKLSDLYRKYGVVSNPNNSYNENISREAIDSITNLVELTGILHNVALDSIYPKLEKEKLRLLKEYSVPTLSDLPADIKAKVDADINNFVTTEIAKFATEQLSLNDEESLIIRKITGNNSIPDSIIPPFAKEYMEIMKGFNPSNVSANVDKIKDLETEIKAKAPTENDLIVTLTGVVTSRYSMQYWPANRGKFLALLITTAENTYPGLTKEESAVVFGKLYGIFPHPSDPEKYIIFPPNEKPRVERCNDGWIFDAKIKNCVPKEMATN